MYEITLIKQLIQIPSFVDGTCDEAKVGQFIYEYLAQFPWLTVQKQFVTETRFNVICFDKFPTTILTIGHIDTVQPQSSWSIDPLNPIEQKGKIFGLGASDMKGGIATILTSIKNIGPTRGCMYLFYIDEEYDFMGMKAFISEYKDQINPELVVSGDGSNLRFGTSCRGLIEITFTVTGKSGHAGNPKSGRNAIVAAMKSVEVLNKQLGKYQDELLGTTSLNVAYIQGGLNQGETLGKQGNVIADYCEFVIDVRPAVDGLTASVVIEIVKSAIEKFGCTAQAVIRHDLGAWKTDISEVQAVIKLLDKPRLSKNKGGGFIDIQMLWQTFNKVPSITFGPCEPNIAHKPDEYVKISSLIKSTQFFTKLLNQYAEK